MTGAPSPNDVWAKLKYRDDDPKTGEIVAWHPLVAHSADVAAVMEQLLEKTILGRRLARLMGWDDLSDVHVARLAALAALHDAGKCNHNFQDQAFPNPPKPRGHVQPMVNVLSTPSLQEKLLLPLGLEPMMGWFQGRKDPTHILSATWGHHGIPKHGQKDAAKGLWYPREGGARNPLAGIEDLGRNVQSWFPRALKTAEAFPANCPRFQHAYNGLLTLADWIGSGFPYLEDGEAETNVMERARGIAAARLEKSALIASAYQAAIPEGMGFNGVLKRAEWEPRPVQEETLSHPVYDQGGVSILESDTGSGKTEAAIARFFRLYQAGKVDGLYFAVPTRTAAKQLYRRVYQIVKRIYESREQDAPPVIQAVPGYYKVDDVEGVAVDRFSVRWHDDQEEDAVQERRWAAAGPKRFLAGAIVVGTVDQVLLSTLQAKHAHMRGGALLRHFLVVDEVHASSVYMTHLLASVLDQHLAAGGHALLMSATLGCEARKRLTLKTYRQDRDLPSLDDAIKTGYPLVTHVGAERREPEEVKTTPSDFRKPIRMSTRPVAAVPDEIANAAIDAAKRGARVLIIRNLVKDCVDVQRAVEEKLGDEAKDLLLTVGGRPVPHHSRYADEDRSRLDDAIEAAFGEVDEDGNEIPIRGVIAVATTTVQMSLDISASLMITDLCPVDVMLQRLGRLHRHGRAHPEGFEKARCVVLVPEERDLSAGIVRGGDKDGSGLKGKHGLGTVYKDLRMLEATWRLLEDESLSTWTIPEDNRRLVERGTHPDVLREIVEDADGTEAEDFWRRHDEWVHGERMASSVTAKHVMLPYETPFASAAKDFGQDLDAVKTRLGQNDVRVEFKSPMKSPLAPEAPASIKALSIPEHLIRDHGEPAVDLDGLEVDTDPIEEGGFSFSANGKSFAYRSSGVQKTDG